MSDQAVTAPNLRIVSFAIVYFALTSLTLAMTRVGGGLALVWFGSAITAIMLLGLAREHWARGIVAIMLTGTLAISLFGFGPRTAAPLALINGVEAWLIARLLLIARPRRDWLDSTGGLIALVALGGIVIPGLTGIVGGAIASLSAPGPWFEHVGVWWAAHGLGTLIGFPMVYLASSTRSGKSPARWSAARLLEFQAHLAVIALTAVLAFSQSLLPLLFLPIAPLLFAAFRCGRRGATFGVLIVAASAAWSFGSSANLIASLEISPAHQIVFLQFYLATITLLALPVSVALRSHRLLMRELEERKALERLIADYSDDALVNLDARGCIRYASPAGARLSGEEDLLGKSIALFFDPLDEPLVQIALEMAAHTPGETRTLERPVLRGEEQIWLQAKIHAVSHNGQPGGVQGYAVTIRDVSARKRTELDAIEAAQTDALTGLPNRRALLGQLDCALPNAAKRPFAIGIVDLDHFKAVNDQYGHGAGDDVLREVAGVMRRLSTPGRYFARLGGEEFALVSRQGDFAAAEALSEQLRRDVAALGFTAPDGTRFTVTASIGLAPIARAMSAAEALEAADTLLYAAKDGGRDRVACGTPAPPRRAHRKAA